MNTLSCKGLFLSLVPFILLGAAAAQDTQRVEVFGGYSLLHDSILVPGAANFSGWDTSATIFLNRWLGVTADFSGHYGSSTMIVPPPLTEQTRESSGIVPAPTPSFSDPTSPIADRATLRLRRHFSD
jgi:hypothetical protein